MIGRGLEIIEEVKRLNQDERSKKKRMMRVILKKKKKC